MAHILNCDSLNKKTQEEIYQQIFQKITVFERFEEYFKKRMEMEMNDSNHVIHDSDSLYSDLYETLQDWRTIYVSKGSNSNIAY
jgi:hypothetical protein